MRSLIIGTLAALLLSGTAMADMNTYSEGYRMGQLSKYSYKGVIVKTGEGELLLGSDSTPLTKKDDKGKTITVNPWAFSSDYDIYEKYKPLVGEYVYIKYRQLQVQLSSLGGDTDYRALEIVKIDQTKPIPTGCSRDGWSFGDKSDGDRVGRLVKVTTKGTLAKTWETTMQVGNAGSQFVDMSILDEKIYNCAVEFLKAGAKVKITYRQSLIRNPLSRDTDYEIVGIAATATLQ